MKRFLKEQKGITLVALIITIIVMLILVAVTINVALNGGIFERAKTAQDQTRREADKEQLLSLVAGTLNNKGDLQINIANLEKEDWTVSEVQGNAEYLECQSPNNEVYYVNKDTGKILDEIPKPNEYGFYFDKEYIYNYTNSNNQEIMVFRRDGTLESIRYEEMHWTEGSSKELKDLTGTITYASVSSLEFNHEYTGTGLMGETYRGIVNDSGNLTTYVEFPSGSMEYSTNKATLKVNSNMYVDFSNQGTTAVYSGKTYQLNNND